MLDVNDHPPMFEELEYNVTISELAEKGTSIVTVMATDADAVSCDTAHGHTPKHRHTPEHSTQAHSQTCMCKAHHH